MFEGSSPAFLLLLYKQLRKDNLHQSTEKWGDWKVDKTDTHSVRVHGALQGEASVTHTHINREMYNLTEGEGGCSADWRVSFPSPEEWVRDSTTWLNE